MPFGFLRMAGQKTNLGSLGLEVSKDGIAIAHIQHSNGDRPKLKTCEFISADAITSRTQTLRDRISALGLNKTPCNWVLVNPEYNLLLVESPKVPEQELREAMRWRIKELINFPVEEAVVDVFPLPSDGSRGAPMTYVVVSERVQIQSIVDTAISAKIRLKNIDIGEMSLRNVADLLAGDGRGACLVRLRQGQGNLALIKQEHVYMSRQFEIPYNAGLLDDLPEENLVLELQRSIDYYERQQGQVPPSKLLFCGENISDDKLTEGIKASLPGQSEVVQLNQLMDGAEQWEESLLQLCVGAIGGALRRQVVA